MALKQVRTASSLLAITGVIIGQFLVGVVPAFADNGKFQPVWCKFTGNDEKGVWKAELADNGNGKDGPLYGPVTGYNVNEDNQVLAHDRSDKLDAACAEQHPKPVTPAAPSFDDMSCDVNDTVSYTIPASEKFYYTVQFGDGNENSVSSGTHALSRINQSVTIRAYSDKNLKKLVTTWPAHSYTIPVCNPGTGNEKPPVTPPTPQPVTPSSTPVVAPAVTTPQATALPQTGPGEDMTTAMSMLVFPVIAYGLTYLARQRFVL